MGTRGDIAAIILAAGSSSRMGDEDKLLRLIEGKPLLRRVVENVCASDLYKCVVVVRQFTEEYQNVLKGFDIDVVEVPAAKDGMSVSLVEGVKAIGPKVGAYMICFSDMPDLTPDDFNYLAQTFMSASAYNIIRPKTLDDRFGHPVLFGSKYFDELTALKGDVGARAIISNHPDEVLEVVMSDNILTDLDTPEDWQNWGAGKH